MNLFFHEGNKLTDILSVRQQIFTKRYNIQLKLTFFNRAPVFKIISIFSLTTQYLTIKSAAFINKLLTV